MTILDVEKINVGYGDIQVIWDVSLKIEENDFVALAGSNGAGKTTLLRCLSGVLRPISGYIYFLGQKISGMKINEFVEKGIIHVPEGRELFYGMTVEENLLLGAFQQKKKTKQLSGDLERIYYLFPELKKRRKHLSGLLSGGEQQMCALGRGLMGKPKLLLIDELSLGLAPVVVDRLSVTLTHINKQDGITIVLVEQDVQLAFSLTEKGYVIETGSIKLEGQSKALLKSAEVKRAYLGI
jgi:branched-chain amino acid transport system ATP-binding protein